MSGNVAVENYNQLFSSFVLPLAQNKVGDRDHYQSKINGCPAIDREQSGVQGGKGISAAVRAKFGGGVIMPNISFYSVLEYQ
ncbi:MAG: hypothetical protein U5Q03_04175 [Bacteroidota bacterium]|nr:hypothetical protein [Bacteroidota bacterium]